MIRTILAIAAAGFAWPAFAMDDMSCSDFAALDATAQAKVVADMQEGMAGEGTMASGGMMSATDAGAGTPEETTMHLAATCAQHPEMMLSEAVGMLPQ
jgi:hypothetical protein